MQINSGFCPNSETLFRLKNENCAKWMQYKMIIWTWKFELKYSLLWSAHNVYNLNVTLCISETRNTHSAGSAELKIYLGMHEKLVIMTLTLSHNKTQMAELFFFFTYQVKCWSFDGNVYLEYNLKKWFSKTLSVFLFLISQSNVTRPLNSLHIVFCLVIMNHLAHRYTLESQYIICSNVLYMKSHIQGWSNHNGCRFFKIMSSLSEHKALWASKNVLIG